MKTKNLIIQVSFVLLVVFLFSSCAELQHIDTCKAGHTYGFLGGLWHGIIAPFSFVCSLFMDDVAVCAVNNNQNFSRMEPETTPTGWDAI